MAEAVAAVEPGAADGAAEVNAQEAAASPGAKAAAALSAKAEAAVPSAAAQSGDEHRPQHVTNGAGDRQAQEASGATAPRAPPPQQLSAAEAAKAATAIAVDELFATARLPDFTKVLTLLDERPDLWTAVDESNHTLLHWAALVGNKDFVKAAIAKGIPVNATANNLQIPLMWAVTRGHLSTVRELLHAKADVCHHDNLGATPLMIAVQHRMHPCVLLIMSHGGQHLLKDADKNGCTAAHWAAYKGDTLSLSLLEYFGADLQAIDNKGMLPLHRATSAAQAHAVEWLISKKADPMMRNKDGQSCLDIAESQKDMSMQALLKKLMQRSGKAFDLEQDAEKGSSGEGGKKTSLRADIVRSLAKDKAGQKIFPVFWVVCVALAFFQYLMDFRAVSYTVVPTASMLFELGVLASLALFAWVALGDPGRIPNGVRGKSGVEELMRSFDSDVSDDMDPQAMFSRLCLTTFVLKDLRTKYCTSTGACVAEFDHYCVWLNTSIGRGNHRQFIVLAVVEGLTQMSHVYLCWSMARELVPYKSAGSWLFSVLLSYPLLSFMFLIQCVTVPWVCVLISHQVRLVLQNLTTNEMMNMHRYEHFWMTTMIQPGRLSRVFTNPFHKGSAWKNCVDFWWARKRSEKGVGYVAPVFGCGQGCSHEHGHGHGHGHAH